MLNLLDDVEYSQMYHPESSEFDPRSEFARIYQGLVIAYPRKNEIIFSVADNIQGLERLTISAIPTGNAIARIYQSSLTISRAKEFRGPAAEVCKLYADYMRELLKIASKLDS